MHIREKRNQLAMEQLWRQIDHPILKSFADKLLVAEPAAVLRAGVDNRTLADFEEQRGLDRLAAAPNEVKVKLLIDATESAAIAQESGTVSHLVPVAAFHRYCDCIARFILERGLKLSDSEAARLTAGYQRRLKAYVSSSAFSATRIDEDADQARKNFFAAVMPHAKRRSLRVFGLQGGRAQAALEKMAVPSAEWLTLDQWSDIQAVRQALALEPLPHWQPRPAPKDGDAARHLPSQFDGIIAFCKREVAALALATQGEVLYGLALDWTMLSANSTSAFARDILKSERERALYKVSRAPFRDRERENTGDWSYHAFADIADEYPELMLAYDAYRSRKKNADAQVYVDFAERFVADLSKPGALGDVAVTDDFYVAWIPHE